MRARQGGKNQMNARNARKRKKGKNLTDELRTNPPIFFFFSSVRVPVKNGETMSRAGLILTDVMRRLDGYFV